jgi:RsiW-degrading membrane proteinase PrsW (M82 family)
MACGIGFDLIETSGYISQGYKDWLDVAIQRSTAGLLHGFGAGMVALGWYFLTHRNSTKYNRILLGLGCGLYAVVQHAIWNGSFLVQLLPDPVGPYLDHGMVTLGLISFQAVLLTYLFESLLMLTFFVFVTGQLRGKIDKPPFWKRIRKPSLDPGVAKLA